MSSCNRDRTHPTPVCVSVFCLLRRNSLAFRHAPCKLFSKLFSAMKQAKLKVKLQTSFTPKPELASRPANYFKTLKYITEGWDREPNAAPTARSSRLLQYCTPPGGGIGFLPRPYRSELPNCRKRAVWFCPPELTEITAEPVGRRPKRRQTNSEIQGTKGKIAVGFPCSKRLPSTLLLCKARPTAPGSLCVLPRPATRHRAARQNQRRLALAFRPLWPARALCSAATSCALN